MKVRLRGNSIRYRLSKIEAAQLASGSRIEQITEFSVGLKLSFFVETSPNPSVAVTAVFHDSCLTVSLPQAMVKMWASTGQVTIQATQQIDPERNLEILVEKDFECLHGDGRDDEDSFPNPANEDRPTKI